MRTMKRHIFNRSEEDRPLCWGDKCIEFDTKEAAKKFVKSLGYAQSVDAYVKECIMYYDGGYVNLTGYTRDEVCAAVDKKCVEFYKILKDAVDCNDPITILALQDVQALTGEVTI